MRSLFCLFLVPTTSVLCAAHLCLLNPKQRGSLAGLNKAGAADCLLLSAPCGDRPAETPATIWRTGQNASVVFQKNLDHWDKANSGYFAVFLIRGSSVSELTRVVDNGETSLHVYSVSVTIPSTMMNGTYKLQLIYTHLCLLNPLQRGGVTDLNKKGSSACFLVKGPCGEKQDQAPDTFWTVGENVTVVFQKNLDHWTKANPGYFSISLMNATVIKELTRVPDMGEVSLTLYTPTIAVPQSLSTGAYTLQVMYVTNNPAAPEAFYQCTDVGIINS